MLNGIEPPNKTKNDSHLWDTMLHKKLCFCRQSKLSICYGKEFMAKKLTLFKLHCLLLIRDLIFICLFIYLFIYLFIHLFTYLFIYLFIHLFLSLFIYYIFFLSSSPFLSQPKHSSVYVNNINCSTAKTSDKPCERQTGATISQLGSCQYHP